MIPVFPRGWHRTAHLDDTIPVAKDHDSVHAPAVSPTLSGAPGERTTLATWRPDLGLGERVRKLDHWSWQGKPCRRCVL